MQLKMPSWHLQVQTPSQRITFKMLKWCWTFLRKAIWWWWLRLQPLLQTQVPPLLLMITWGRLHTTLWLLKGSKEHHPLEHTTMEGRQTHLNTCKSLTTSRLSLRQESIIKVWPLSTPMELLALLPLDNRSHHLWGKIWAPPKVLRLPISWASKLSISSNSLSTQTWWWWEATARVC